MKKQRAESTVSQNLIVLVVSFFVALGLGFLLVNHFQDAILKLLV